MSVKVGVFVVVPWQNGYLGLQCSKGRGIILPGGKPKPGETFREAAIRELFEETGIIVDDLELIFQGFENNCYGYTFLAKKIVGGRLTDSVEGELVVASPEQFVDKSCKMRAYNELVFLAINKKLKRDLLMVV